MLPHMCIAFQSFSPFTVTSTRKRSFSISLLDLAGLFFRIGTAYCIRCPFVWTPLGFTQVHPAVRAELRDIFGKLLEQRLLALLRIRHILLDAPSPSAVGAPDAVHGVYDGHTLVVFEELTKQSDIDSKTTDVTVAEHKDINDEGQSVTVTSTPAGSTYGKTGVDMTNIAIAIGILLIAAGCATAYGIKSRKTTKGDADESAEDNTEA